MKNFFRYYFTQDWASSEGAAFHELYTFSSTMGYEVYSLVFRIVTTLVLICTGIVFIKGYMAEDAQDRAESKDKLVRTVLIVFAVMSVASILNIIYKIFSWDVHL